MLIILRSSSLAIARLQFSYRVQRLLLSLAVDSQLRQPVGRSVKLLPVLANTVFHGFRSLQYLWQLFFPPRHVHVIDLGPNPPWGGIKKIRQDNKIQSITTKFFILLPHLFGTSHVHSYKLRKISKEVEYTLLITMVTSSWPSLSCAPQRNRLYINY
jgi:hypothetical protein